MRLMRAVAPAVIGALTGVGATMVLQSRTRPVSPQPQPIIVAPPDRRVEALAAEVQALAQAANAASPPTTKATPPPTTVPREPADAESRQAAAERFAREFEARLAARSGEPRDASWASSKETSIRNDLPRIAAGTNQSFLLVKASHTGPRCCSIARGMRSPD